VSSTSISCWSSSVRSTGENTRSFGEIPKRSVVIPTEISSPGSRRIRFLMCTPLTCVPLFDLRSLMYQMEPSGVSSACRRETVLSVMGSASEERPMSCG